MVVDNARANTEPETIRLTEDREGARRPGRAKSAPARRALEEAARRRAEADAAAMPRPKEIDGRDGPDPARYGDWEVKGIISDF